MTLLGEAQKADEIRDAKTDLVAAFRWAVRLGLSEGIDNHFSVMIPGSSDKFVLSEYGLHWSEVRASNLVTLDFSGRVLEGLGPPDPTAFYIHSRMHKYGPNAQCILHTHMPYATALSAIQNGRLEMCLQTSILLHDLIAYDDNYRGLALDNAEGDRMVQALGNKRILFLGNHGILVIGQSVADAFDHLYYVERACQIQVLAMSTGRNLRIVPDCIVQSTLRQVRGMQGGKSHFHALKRMLYSLEPDFDH